jgi:hypothetical protein
MNKPFLLALCFLVGFAFGGLWHPTVVVKFEIQQPSEDDPEEVLTPA